MPIKLIENASADGMTDFVCVAVEDFADDSQTEQVIETACEVLGKIKGASKMWSRKEDCCYRVTGGLLRKNGGKKALDKVAKELDAMGYGRVIERSQSDVRKARP